MSGRAAAGSVGALLALGVLWLLAEGSRPVAPISPGTAAPGFELGRVGDGPPVSLESLRGQVVLLNFWATWCKPCEDEMPAMQRLYEALRDEPFELVAVSVDDGEEEVRRFRDRLGLEFPILHDPDKRVSGRYQSHRFPETYLIDRDGTLVARYIGPREWDAPEYRERIRRLLAPAEPAG